MTNDTALPPEAAPGTREYVRFAVFGDARTGSTMIVHGLNDHPEIRCFREVFNWTQDFVDFYLEGYDARDEAAFAQRKADPHGFLRDRIFGEHPAGTKAVGYKFLYNHMFGFKGIVDGLVADTDLKIIHIKRGNLLRALVSTKIAQHTGRWVELDRRPEPLPIPGIRDVLGAFVHPKRAIRKANAGYRRWRPPEPTTGPYAKADPASRGVPFELAYEECVEFFQKASTTVAEWDELFAAHDMISVHYEDFLKDEAREFEKLQRFLGVKPRRVTADTRRQNPEPLRALISNYDELRAQFADTEAAAYFD